MIAAEVAEQLDSVTNMVHENFDMDESKANNAMTVISTTLVARYNGNKKLENIQVSKEVIALIVTEVEVLDDVPERELREVVPDRCEVGNGGVVVAALQKLIVS